MPIEDERAAWLTGLRDTDRVLHATLDNEVAAREIKALQERIVALQAQVASLRGAVSLRDRMLADDRVAIAERDRRIDELTDPDAAARPGRVRVTLSRAAAAGRRAVRDPGSLTRATRSSAR